MSDNASDWNTSGIPRLRVAVITFLVLAFVPYVAPGLERFQAWSDGDPIPFAGLFNFEMSMTRGGDAGGIAAPVSSRGEGAEEAAAALGEDLVANMGELEIPSAPTPKKGDAEPVPAAEEPVEEIQVAVAPEVPSVVAVPQVVIAETEVSGVEVAVQIPPGALDRFFAKLEKTARGEAGALTRIAHYGDSTIAADDVTKTLRRNFQKRILFCLFI